MEYQGLVIGFSAVVMVIVCRYIARKYERILAGRLWPAVLALGIVAIIGSFFINEIILSAFAAVFGCTCLWVIYKKVKTTSNF